MTNHLMEISREVKRRADLRTHDVLRLVATTNWNLPICVFTGWNSYQIWQEHTLSQVFWHQLFGANGCGEPWSETRREGSHVVVARSRTVLVYVPEDRAFVRNILP